MFNILTETSHVIVNKRLEKLKHESGADFGGLTALNLEFF
jgi:hypothetical protein